LASFWSLIFLKKSRKPCLPTWSGIREQFRLLIALLTNFFAVACSRAYTWESWRDRGVSESMRTVFMLVKSFCFVFSTYAVFTYDPAFTLTIPFFYSKSLLDLTTLNLEFITGFLFSLLSIVLIGCLFLIEVDEVSLARVPLVRYSGISCFSTTLGLKSALLPPTMRLGTEEVCFRTTGAAWG